MNRREFHTCWISAAVGIALPRLSFGQSPRQVDDVLKAARTALGGDSRVAGVQSLTAKAKFRRLIGTNEMSGELQLDLLLPDRLMKTETLSLPGGAEATMIDALNGKESWRDTRSGPTMGGGQIMIRRPQASDPAALARQQRDLQAELARFSVGLLVSAPSSLGLTATYAGEAEADDGKAHAIDLNGDGIAMRLYLDLKTHLPLMITYKTAAPRVVMQTFRADGPDARQRAAQAAQSAEHRPPEPAAPPAEVEAQWIPADYQATGGIQFPRRLTRMLDGKVSEEWEFTEFKVNPGLKPDQFQKK